MVRCLETIQYTIKYKLMLKYYNSHCRKSCKSRRVHRWSSKNFSFAMIFLSRTCLATVNPPALTISCRSFWSSENLSILYREAMLCAGKKGASKYFVMIISCLPVYKFTHQTCPNPPQFKTHSKSSSERMVTPSGMHRIMQLISVSFPSISP